MHKVKARIHLKLIYIPIIKSLLSIRIIRDFQSSFYGFSHIHAYQILIFEILILFTVFMIQIVITPHFDVIRLESYAQF